MNELDTVMAFSFAKEKHEGQMYGDIAYIYHLSNVVKTARNFDLSAKHIVLAYLHDTIEDGVSDYTEIFKEFGSEMAELVSAISRDKDNETYSAYIRRIKSYNGVVREVKICDILCNLEECIKNPTPKNEGRILRYKKALFFLGS
jgi:(p)ppGpp synthase/HD superfamily hydrolase